MKYNSLLIGLFMIVLIAGANDPFADMDMAARGLRHGNLKFDLNSPKGHSSTFAVLRLDLNSNWQCVPEFTEATDVKLFAPLKEYTIFGLGIPVYQDNVNLDIEVSELTGPTIIAKENILIRSIVPPASNPNYRYIHLLLPPRLEQLRKNDFVRLLFYVRIPDETIPGFYKGMITIRSKSSKAIRIPLSLQVMDFELPDSGNFGFFLFSIPYDPARKGRQIAAPGYEEKNLDAYFRFNRARRLNSYSLFYFIPDLRYIDGKVTGTFKQIESVFTSMKNANVNGKVMLDLRQVVLWSDAVARKLEIIGSKAPQGDLGVTMREKTKEKTLEYHPNARKIFGKAVHFLIGTAKQRGWPEIRLFPDEEIMNAPDKTKRYDEFIHVLLKEAPEYAAILDNSVYHAFLKGLKVEDCDFGARDKVPLRQYNTWPKKALENAQEDNAAIWSYNYDAKRLSFGFAQQRLKSAGHHQWADQWGPISPHEGWIFNRISSQGIVTSLEMEMIHEGCVDYAACEYLKTLISRLRKNGKDSLADRLQKNLQSAFMDLPTMRPDVLSFNRLTSESDLNARRQVVFSAIAEALGQTSKKLTSAGKPALNLIKIPSEKIAKDTGKLHITLNTREGKLSKNAEKHEKFWGSWIGPMKLFGRKIAEIRAVTSSVKEFENRSAIGSNCSGFLGCIPDGLAVYLSANHVQPSPPYRYTRSDDAFDLWQDDCMEAFFKLPNGETYQLIVNSAGAVTFLKNGKIIPSARIIRYTKSPLNKSGGTSVKLLIPWDYFGLKGCPPANTVWKFNLGREFHSWGLYLTWAPVYALFNETEKWGYLLFTGYNDSKYFSSLNISPIYTGSNTVTGKMKKIPNFSKLRVEIIDQSQKTVASAAVKANHTFQLSFTAGILNNNENWKFQLIQGNSVLETFTIPAVQSKLPQLHQPLTPFVIQGEKFCFQGESTMMNQILSITLKHKEKHIQLPSVNMESGQYKFQLDTTGLEAGIWQLEFSSPALRSGPENRIQFHVLSPLCFSEGEK